MNFENKLNLIFISLFILLPVVYTSLSSPITATDWIYRHTLWIQSYLNGSLNAVFEYLPLFHWLMMPFVFFNVPMQLFQIIFSVMNLLVIFWFLNSNHNVDAAVYCGLFMASSIIYMQISSALMPQALNLVLFLPALHYYMNGRYKTSLLFVTLLFSMHLTAIIYAFVLLVYSLYQKSYKYALAIVLIALLFSPLYYNYLFVVNEYKTLGAYQWNVEAQAQWDSWFYDPWWHLFATSGIFAWFYLPYVIRKLRKRNFYISEKQKLYLLWMLSFVPIGLGFKINPFVVTFKAGEIWRMLTFMIIPFYFFLASVLSEDDKQTDKDKYMEKFKKLFGTYKVAK